MIYTFGETILDMIFKAREPVAARPGGAMLNTAVSLGRCKVPVSLISEISHDLAGGWILDFLKENRVRIDNMMVYKDGKTPLSIAQLDDTGEASYDFFKLYPQERLENLNIRFSEGDLLLFGSFYSIQPEIRTQVRRVLAKAAETNVILLYDPNIRVNHVQEVKKLVPVVRENMMAADVIRASKDDIFNIYGNEGHTMIEELTASHGKIFILTDGGAAGSFISPRFTFTFHPGRVDTVSSIGAGDTFNAGILYGLYRSGMQDAGMLHNMSEDSWRSIVDSASLFAADCCRSVDNYVSTSFGEKM